MLLEFPTKAVVVSEADTPESIVTFHRTIYERNPPRRVEVWFVPVGASHTQVVRTLRGLLNEGERRRLDCLRVESDRARFAVVHALVRVALSQMYPAAPTDWRLDRTVAGKPFVCEPGGAQSIQFSLSHTRGVVACAVAGTLVGLDLEPLDQNLEVDELLPHTMGAQELVHWNERPNKDGVCRFLSYWTLKEALVKGLGVGMMVPFSSIEFEFEDNDRPKIIALPLSLGDASHWKLRRLDLMGTHVGAVAVRSEPGEAVEVCLTRLEVGTLVRAFE